MVFWSLFNAVLRFFSGFLGVFDVFFLKVVHGFLVLVLAF